MRMLDLKIKKFERFKNLIALWTIKKSKIKLGIRVSNSLYSLNVWVIYVRPSQNATYTEEERSEKYAADRKQRFLTIWSKRKNN